MSGIGQLLGDTQLLFLKLIYGFETFCQLKQHQSTKMINRFCIILFITFFPIVGHMRLIVAINKYILKEPSSGL